DALDPQEFLLKKDIWQINLSNHILDYCVSARFTVLYLQF
ncbi:hypothetical protein JL09_g6692, partial [Pichia kudriavzevii]